MWPLKSRRRVAESRDPDRDSGVVLVWVALTMVVMLGIAALVIDIGALLVENRELQNGADAAALAVAQDCAGPDGCPTAMGTARDFAGYNAEDGMSAIETLCGKDPDLDPCGDDYDDRPPVLDIATGWVRVGTATETETGDQIDFLLAPIMKNLLTDGATMHREAVAAWGTPRNAATLPFTFARCFYDNLVETGEQIVTIYSKMATSDEPVCPTGQSGGTPVPGGFGWLSVADSVECTTEDLGIGDEVILVGNSGANAELQRCEGKESLIKPVSGVNKIVAIPMYESVDKDGGLRTYTIVGFAGFEIMKYNLGGQYKYPSGWTCPEGAAARCMEGSFRDVVIGDGEIGGTEDFGATVIQMVG